MVAISDVEAKVEPFRLELVQKLTHFLGFYGLMLLQQLVELDGPCVLRVPGLQQRVFHVSIFEHLFKLLSACL